VWLLSESASISVVVITTKDDHVAAINTALRDAGHAAHCSKISRPDDLEASIAKCAPDMIILCDTGKASDLQHTCQVRNTCAPHTPILFACIDVTEDRMAAAMEDGARDVVSLKHIQRFQAVANRELRAFQLENALESVIGSANQYKQELHSLKQISVEAIAEIQEGIIVNANPAWLELFGYPNDADLTGHPVMDLCRESDRPILKGALVACQRGKWKDSSLDIHGLRPDAVEFPTEFSLENVEYDGDPAVRMLVAPDLTADDSSPEQFVEQAIQRDQVTGFFNRNHFLKVVDQRLDTPPKGGVRALVYLRPDKFSKAHRDVGLLGTESIISQLSQFLRDFTQPTDICGRFGGTMFTAMLERGNMADVEAWTEQFLKAIADTVFEHDQQSTVITCSAGLVEIDTNNVGALKLVSDAERACHISRSQGGNRIEHSESSGAAKQIRQDDDVWVPRIRSALMENRLRLEHQPIAGLNDDVDGTFDTLVRMLDGEGNTILPGEFMPVAARTGLTKNVDRWVIGASLSFCSSSEAQLVFIRLSRDSLLDKTLPDWLKSQTEQATILPAKICFEVDETVISKHLRQTQILSQVLHEMGFKFAIEHFGKREDSGRVIDHIEMEYIKIDGSLMQGLHKNQSAQARIKELCIHAQEKNILTIAERVQDANTMAILWQLGVSHIQGDYVQNSEIVMEDTSHSTQTTLSLTM
jgi:diguanylate cyclase (GGDEF)-like protein/PAS domain S-box-containing protein